MNMQTGQDEARSGLFDQCSAIQERLNEALLTAARLIGTTPREEAVSKDVDACLDNLACRLGEISRDMGHLVERLQEIERRF